MNEAAILRALRLQAGLTQRELAEKAGLDRSWLNQMERGKKRITRAPREKLAAVLGVNPMELGGDEQDDPKTFRSLEDRLVVVEKALAKERKSRERALRAALVRLADLEAALELQARQAGHR